MGGRPFMVTLLLCRDSWEVSADTILIQGISMKAKIRKAELRDVASIARAEQEIAQEPGFFCSQPSELSEQNVRNTIKSSNGIYFVAEYNSSIAGHAFLEILPLQSLKHITQLNIAVHKGFQSCGIGTQLMERIIEWAKESESVEKIELNVRASNAQAIALYKKMGFLEEGCLKRHVKTRNGYIDDILMALHVKGSLPDRKISRTGVYGVAKENGKVLLVIQKSGPFAGLFDLPGGGIEFGEDPIRALHREFIEETGMDFRSMNHIDNFSAVTHAPALNGKPGYEFHQIGLIYSVEGLHDLEENKKGSLKCDWVDIRTLKKDAVSPFVREIIQASSP
jgi:ribosomal protein S18 acetylase RimI-like enzyme